MTLTLRIVDVGALGAGLEAATRAAVGPVDPDWLARLAALAQAPLALDLFALTPHRLGAAPASADTPHELDAFALTTVYGQVLWDDRMPGWHAESGHPQSAALLRALHDLALRAYRRHDDGERLVLIRT